ncbi:MAG TPA: phasin [Xanthobacteraceae bacterium]|nr:phasin [Xanthobacteraceae bacterium]
MRRKPWIAKQLKAQVWVGHGWPVTAHGHGWEAFGRNVNKRLMRRWRLVHTQRDSTHCEMGIALMHNFGVCPQPRRVASSLDELSHHWNQSAVETNAAAFTKEAKMSKDKLPSFEIPGEIRQLAEQSVEQAKKAVDGFINAAQQAVDTLEGHAAAAQAGAKGVGRKAMTFATENVASSFAFAEKLVRAQDAQEVMRLQSEFMRSQLEALSQQARELGDAAARSAMESVKPKT